MQWDSSSRAAGRQFTRYSAWLSQGQIKAVVPFSCVPAGPHFSLGTVVPLSLCFVCIPKISFWPWDWRLQFITLWCPRGPPCLETANKARARAGLLRADKLPLAETHCPSVRMGRHLCSIHHHCATTQMAGEWNQHCRDCLVSCKSWLRGATARTPQCHG